MTTSPYASSAEFFEAKYQEAGDPWKFASDAYELRRCDAIVDALAGRRYSRAFEPGCSIGVLTARLGLFCEEVEAIDPSPTAVKQAIVRCVGMPNVKIRCDSLPEALPAPGVDLIVCSEVGYYFSAQAWRDITAELEARMKPGAIMLAAHWLGESQDHALSADTVHEILHKSGHLKLELSLLPGGFRLDRWVKS